MTEHRFGFDGADDQRRVGDPHGSGEPVVAALDHRPGATPRPLVVVDRDDETSARGERDQRVLEGLPHRARVMQDAPRVHDVEGAEPAEIVRIERRAVLDAPA